MADKLRKSNGRHENHFPPEADSDFGIVSDEQVADLRKQLAERYGIGQGRMKVIEEPS